MKMLFVNNVIKLKVRVNAMCIVFRTLVFVRSFIKKQHERFNVLIEILLQMVFVRMLFL